MAEKALPLGEDVAGASLQCRNRSHDNEDRVSIGSISEGNLRFIAVLDGHGGSGCSEYMHTYLKDTVAHTLESSNGNTEQALKLGLDITEINFFQKSSNDSSGCCVVVALVDNTHITIANVGDCRAILVGRAETVFSTQDHRPTDPTEQSRVEAAGGFVVRNRVFGLLGVSRSLGDKDFKTEDVSGSVISTPDISKIPLSPDHEFLVLASDGVWDRLSTEDVLTLVFKSLYADHMTCSEVSNLLVHKALVAGSGDDISAAILRLRTEPVIDVQSFLQRRMESAGDRLLDMFKRRASSETSSEHRSNSYSCVKHNKPLSGITHSIPHCTTVDSDDENGTQFFDF